MRTRRVPQVVLVLSLIAVLLALSTGTVLALGPTPLGDYRELPGMGSGLAVWMAVELHLMFAAFVLAVSMLALVEELIGMA